MFISWATFGISFWMLIRGLISTVSVPVRRDGYVRPRICHGLIAIVAPGGSACGTSPSSAFSRRSWQRGSARREPRVAGAADAH